MTQKNHIKDCLLWQENRPTATFKKTPNDFIVNEILEWDFKGGGEHIFLYIEKINCNTMWVAKQLAAFYGVPARDVGYSGLKDRNAKTRQYFSIRLPGVKSDSYEIPTHEEYAVISHSLHDKKLKRGNHSFNEFIITLHDVDETATTLVEERLTFIRDNGCPNLFDSQRFGRDNSNLAQLEMWLKGEIAPRKRDEKSLLLSSLRSAIFNQQLGKRVTESTWNKLEKGDIVILDGSNSHFTIEEIDDTLIKRAEELDIHPAGILVGEESVLDESLTHNEIISDFMNREHLKSAYRSLRLNVKNLQWRKADESTWEVSMSLPSGAYASGVIKQAFDIG